MQWTEQPLQCLILFVGGHFLPVPDDTLVVRLVIRIEPRKLDASRIPITDSQKIVLGVKFDLSRKPRNFRNRVWR